MYRTCYHIKLMNKINIFYTHIEDKDSVGLYKSRLSHDPKAISGLAIAC